MSPGQVWQELSGALLLLLPLVQSALPARRVPGRAAARGAGEAGVVGGVLGLLWRPPPRPGTPPAPVPSPGQQRGPTEASTSGAHEQPVGVSEGPADSKPGPCPLCGDEDPVAPVLALPCRHAFCYVCLRSASAASPRFACPVDGVRVAALRRPPPVGFG
jgi:hypothetical protein